ncbi:DUF6151 family protein [Roseateles sp.]|uniref:DUF6151 family protein n=1 Tax=Roseateles sp. TaxID=1971397 RepID=UPI0037CAF4DD
MSYLLGCKCGAVRGQISHAERAIRGVCYCKDCRAYASHLGIQSLTHDALGGADFVATLAKYVTLSDGLQHLACLSLSSSGLMRWYAKCCDTPIGNTPRNWKVAYVGSVRTCLDSEPGAYERSFGDVQMRTNTASAKQAPPGLALKTISTLAGFIPRLVAGSVTGAYKATPFFTSAGTPVATPTVLSREERERAYAAA